MVRFCKERSSFTSAVLLGITLTQVACATGSQRVAPLADADLQAAATGRSVAPREGDHPARGEGRGCWPLWDSILAVR